MGLRGVTRGRAPRTTRTDPRQAVPEDDVRRDFTADAPNQLWVADFTYVATWRGFVYVAFLIDVFARRIVGRLARFQRAQYGSRARCARAGDHDRRPAKGLIQRTDRCAQYLSIR
jgi:transposase InsO family protein